MAGVVIGISRPREPIIRHLVPFFARDLASFATDANGRVGKETDLDLVSDERMSSLVGALDSFADHKSGATFQVAFGSVRKLETCATWNSSLILIFRVVRGHRPIFRQSARQVAAVPDANWAGHPAARIC
jgi:hypothetical protein